jgi:hypothetical protein
MKPRNELAPKRDRELQLTPDFSKAVAALKRIRPKGLIRLGAITPDDELPICRTFDLATEAVAAREWMQGHFTKRRNLHFEAGIPKGRMNKKSAESDIGFVQYHYVDCDPLPGESSVEAKARIYDELASGKVPPPTFTLESGNGILAGWRREKSVKLDSPEPIAECKAVNASLRDALGGKADGKFDDCISLDHLFRVPYTVNFPNMKKRAAGRKVILAGNFQFHADRKYPASAFPAAKAALATDVPAIGDAVSVDLDELTISDRSREIIEKGESEIGNPPDDDSPSGWRMSLIHGLKRDGIDDETILGILLDPHNIVSADRAKKAGSHKAAERFFKKEIAKASAMIAARRTTAADDFDDLPDIPDEHESDEGTDFNEWTPPELAFDLTPYMPQDPSRIPMRKWLYGTAYIRKFIGLTAATGGAGKSSLILVECVAMACGKNLLGVEPAEKLSVLYWNGEDPLEELERRVAAILKYYKLTKADLGQRLFIKSGRDMPIRIAELDQGKAKIAKPMTRAMATAIRKYKLDVVAIDPFVSSHGVPENDNNAIELVAKKWADIADKTNCAVILSHHTRKTNGVGASIEDSRGASSLNYAARTRRAINTMSAVEAKAAGITDDRARLSYFKADMMGSSMIKPTAALDWYRFESVNLMNGAPDEDTGAPTPGDSVGVVVKWEYKRSVLELDADTARKAVSALEEGGPWRADRRADKWAGLAIAKAAGVDVTDDTVKAQIAALLAEWIADSTLEEYSDLDEKRRPKKCLRPMMDFE